ncbi:response regulator [Shewanella sp. UCD-KL12]|uniref:response regulator n=1 Tax=Shewanella sp. UCD-KL12 TaxID=1917163 RepID=UPI0009702953|nr:response regulator [Shewanella sp. UCD-KL12]
MTEVLHSLSSQRPILVIDDCPMYRTAAKGMLQKMGIAASQILLAKDAYTAKQFCITNAIQLVLCDYNLGEKTNGHQLLDELIHNQALQPDCVVIIVTGDASAEVVRGFAELDADGYLVKPLNFKTLQERLPKFTRRKRMIGNLLEAYAKGDYQDTIEQAEESINKAKELHQSTQFLKARSLSKLGQYNDARNILVSLRQGSEKIKVTMELARIAIAQKQYSHSESLLTPLEKDPINCAAALELSAEQFIRQNQFVEALDKISASVSKSPKNVTRQLSKVHIAMAVFDIDNAVTAADSAMQRAKHSFRETIELHQLNVQLLLDKVQLTSPDNRLKLLMNVSRCCTGWRANYSRSKYKAFELIILARANAVRGEISKARVYFTEYQAWLTDNVQYQANSYEQFELAKVYYLLNMPNEYKAVIDSLLSELAAESDTVNTLCLIQYIQQWRSQIEQFRLEAENNKTKAMQSIALGNYKLATQAMLKAVELNQADSEACLRLIECLTHAWPEGWSKKSVGELAIRCKELLFHEDIAKSARHQLHCETLSKQLQLVELAA